MFQGFEIAGQKLCNSDYNELIRVEVWDVSVSGNSEDKFITAAQLKINDILKEYIRTWTLLKNGKSIGSLHL